MPTEQTQTKRKRKSHPFSERKRVVELYESGLGCKRIAQALDLDDSAVSLWLRVYRAKGLEALRPYYGRGADGRPLGVRGVRRERIDRLFSPALEVYSTTLEPVASIVRRHGLDYQSFLYHLKRFHPELIEQRGRLSLPLTPSEDVADPLILEKEKKEQEQ